MTSRTKSQLIVIGVALLNVAAVALSSASFLNTHNGITLLPLPGNLLAIWLMWLTWRSIGYADDWQQRRQQLEDDINQRK